MKKNEKNLYIKVYKTYLNKTFFLFIKKRNKKKQKKNKRKQKKTKWKKKNFCWKPTW